MHKDEILLPYVQIFSYVIGPDFILIVYNQV